MPDNTFNEKAKELEARLRCFILRVEGAAARPIWNRQNCWYYDRCKERKEEKGRRTKCLYNPSMFECLAYQAFEDGS